MTPEIREKIKRYIITSEDIFLSIVGTIGLVGIIPKELINPNLTENCVRLTGLKINQLYLKYFLISSYGQNQIRQLTVGSTQGKLAIHRIKQIQIPFPSPSEQEIIANILLTLDEKIEILQRQNKILEEMGQVIFKKWFIDEKRDEWEISRIGKEFRTILGGTPSRSNKDYWNGTISWINSGAINEFPIMNYTERITEDGLKNSAASPMPRGTIVLPFVISLSKEIKISVLGIESSGNQSVLGILPNENFSSAYIYYWIQNIKADIYSWATGGAQQHINKKNVDDSALLIPDKEMLNKFNLIGQDIFNKILNNSEQIKSLLKLRDSLLPKLMSGKIRAPIK